MLREFLVLVRELQRKFKVKRLFGSVFTFLALVSCCVSMACADEILITNGDRLSGEIVRHDAYSVRLKTGYAGTLDIKWSNISEISLNEPSVVLLKDRTTLEVESFKLVGEELVIQPVGSSNTISVPATSVKVIEPEPWELGQGHKFTGKVNLAIEKESGNSESNELDLDFDMTTRWGKNSMRVFGDLEYDTTRGFKSTDKWSVMASLDHAFSGKWYYAGAMAFKQDQFADLDLRTLVGPGIGYRFFDSKPLNLTFELGPYYLKDNFIAQPDRKYWGAAWFLDYDQFVWKKRLQLYHRQTGFQGIDYTGKFLWRSWTGVRVPLIAGLFGSVEYEIDYDSEPAVEAETTDQTFKLKLGYKW